MTAESFYEQLDIIFDNLYKNYGLLDKLIKYKEILINAYEKEHSYHNIYTKKHTQIYIDENGYIKSK
jgi:hypothetical protein